MEEGDSGKCANPRHSVALDDRQCLSVRSVGAKDPQLSQREREILLRLAEGESNKQIARLCNITESTVKVHLKAILRKITVHNRTQAAIWADHHLPEWSEPIAEQTASVENGAVKDAPFDS